MFANVDQILPGITRRSVLELASQLPNLEVEETAITLPQVITCSASLSLSTLDLGLPYKCKFNFLVWQPSGWTPWFPFAVSFYWRLYFSGLLFGEGLLSLSISAISLCLFIPGECNHDMMILLILGSLKILRLFTSSSFLHCRKVSLSGHYLDIVTLCCKIFWIFYNNNNNKNNENNNNSSIDTLQTKYIA